jgi:hypothetical protein
MRAARDPDHLLIEAMLAPPPLEDARSSLDYWQRRRRSLPLHRRAARREATEMTAHWQERVHAAEQTRFESSLVGRLLTALGLSSLWLRRVRLGKQELFWLAWAVVPRRLKLFVGVLAAATMIFVLGVLLALAVVVVQLA